MMATLSALCTPMAVRPSEKCFANSASFVYVTPVHPLAAFHRSASCRAYLANASCIHWHTVPCTARACSFVMPGSATVRSRFVVSGAGMGGADVELLAAGRTICVVDFPFAKEITGRLPWMYAKVR